MSDTPLQLALRELRETYSNRVALAIIASVGTIAGLTGPFATFEMLDLPARLAYWLLIAFGSYGAGLVGATYAAEKLVSDDKPLWLRIAVAGFGASVPATLVVVMLCIVFLSDFREDIWGHTAWLYFYCLGIALALMALLIGVIQPALEAREQTRSSDAPPPLLERLPHEVRGPLSHLSMADHYVEVFTLRGKAMVLMRLADAIGETKGVPGQQIHRSHWVARDAVKAIRRVDGKTMIETKTGALLPVSRSFLPAVRANL